MANQYLILQIPPAPLLNVSLVYSDSANGNTYNLQAHDTRTNPMRTFLRSLACNGVGGGVKEAWIIGEQFDLGRHPLNDITLTNAIMVEKLCRDWMAHPAIGEYAAAAPLGEDARDSMSQMCQVYSGYMNSYRDNPTIGRGTRHILYNLLKEDLRPTEETDQE